MSTFSDWNGPQGSNVRAGDLVQLANAYSDLVTKLNQHTQEQASASSDVHNVKTYVASQIATIQTALNSYALKSELPASPDLSIYATRAELNNKADTSVLGNYALTSELAQYMKTNDLSTSTIITAIEADIATIQNSLDFNNFQVTDLQAAGWIEGMLRAVEQVQFTFKDFSVIQSSDGTDKFYILGMLDERVGTAYVRYTNTDPFSAVVNFAVTSEEHASLNVTADWDWTTIHTDMEFLVVHGTDTGSNEHFYLAIKGDDWDNIPSISFEAAGINFIPVNSEGYVTSNGLTRVDTFVDMGMADRLQAAEDAIDALDALNRVPVGGIIGWDDMDNIPTGWEAHPDVDFHIRKVTD